MDERLHDRLGWGPLLMLAITVAGVGAACAAAVHNGCFHPPPPVSLPDPPSPRGKYCATALSLSPWAWLTVGPSVLLLLAGVLAGRRVRLVLGLAILLCVILVANAYAANSLTSALTV
jgi:hypothetical protein